MRHGRGPAPERGPAGDIIAGRNAVLEALGLGPSGSPAGGPGGVPLDRVFVADEAGTLAWWRRQGEAAARASGVVVIRSPRAALDRLAPQALHQGVVARRAARETIELEALLETLIQPALLVLVDGVEDPHNLGAIVRSAAAAGAQGVLVPERRSAGPTAGAAKAAAGALERIPIVRVKNPTRALEILAEHGIWSVGLAAGERPIWDGFDLLRPTCLVVGGEEKGLSRLVRERCDDLAGIPMAAQSESLNVSVAAGIALFEVVRRRGPERAAEGTRSGQ